MVARGNEKAVKGETAIVFRTRRHGFAMLAELPADERGVAAQWCGPGNLWQHMWMPALNCRCLSNRKKTKNIHRFFKVQEKKGA